jgi:hypothetical protein
MGTKLLLVTAILLASWNLLALAGRVGNPWAYLPAGLCCMGLVWWGVTALRRDNAARMRIVSLVLALAVLMTLVGGLTHVRVG